MGNDIGTRMQKLHERAITLFGKGKREEALKAGESLLALARSSLGERHPGLEPALCLLGELREACGEPETAERLLREALEIRRFHLGAKDPDLLGSLNRLAGINLQLERFTIAEPLIRESIEICRSLPEESRAVLALPLQSLSQVHFAADRWSEAEEALREALAAAALGESTPQTRDLRANCLIQLAGLLEAMHDSEAALECLDEATTTKRELFGEGNAEVVNVSGRRAYSLRKLGEFEEADEVNARVADSVRLACGEFDASFTNGIDALAATRYLAGHCDDANRLHDLANRIRGWLEEDAPWGAAVRDIEIAKVALEWGELRRAVDKAECSASAFDAAGPTVSGAALESMATSALMNGLLGRHGRSLAQLDRAIAIATSKEGRLDDFRRQLAVARTETLLRLGRADDAETEARIAAEDRIDHPEHGEHWANAKLACGDVEEAARIITATLETCRKTFGDESSRVAVVREVAALVALRSNRPAEAASHFADVLGWGGRQIVIEAVGGRRGNSFPFSEIFATRWSMEALALLSSHGHGAEGNALRIATAAACQLRAVGHSDLQLATLESPTDAELLRPARRAARRLANLDDESDPTTAIHVRARRTAAESAFETAVATARAALPGLDAHRRATDVGREELFARLGVDDRFVHLIRAGKRSLLSNFERRKVKDTGLAGDDRYLAVRIDRGRDEVVDLGDAAELDGLVQRLAGGDSAVLPDLAERLLPAFAPLPTGRLFVAAESRLSEVPFEALASESAAPIGAAVAVVMVPTIGTIAGSRGNTVAAAADEPIWFESPDLSAGVDAALAVGSPAAITFPPRETWWRSLLRRLRLASEQGVPPRQIDLSLRLIGTLEASADLVEDRRRVGAEVPRRSATEPIAGCRLLRAGSASVGTLRSVRSPRWLHLDVPWAVLPDQEYLPTRGETTGVFHCLPVPESRTPRADGDAIDIESPWCRAGLYLACAADGATTVAPQHQGLLRRFPGVLPARGVAELDLSHTLGVVLARPPRCPGTGSTAMAYTALVDAFLVAGARCVVVPRVWATQSEVDAFLQAFYAELKSTPASPAAPAAPAPPKPPEPPSPMEAWRRAGERLRQSGAPTRTWASVAFFV